MDTTLRVAEGALCGVINPADNYLPGFPYLLATIAGSPNGANGVAK